MPRKNRNRDHRSAYNLCYGYFRKFNIKYMKIEVVQGKWNCSDAFLDLFINSKRELKVEVKRTKIGKKYNYKFEFKNREIEDVEVNEYQLVTP